MSIDCSYNGFEKNGKIKVVCKLCGKIVPLKSYTNCISKNNNFDECNHCIEKINGRVDGEKAMYKYESIERLRILKIGEHIMVYNRIRSVVSYWLWKVNCYGTSRKKIEGSNKEFKIESLDKKTHKIIRIE